MSFALEKARISILFWKSGKGEMLLEHDENAHDCDFCQSNTFASSQAPTATPHLLPLPETSLNLGFGMLKKLKPATSKHRVDLFSQVLRSSLRTGNDKRAVPRVDQVKGSVAVGETGKQTCTFEPMIRESDFDRTTPETEDQFIEKKSPLALSHLQRSHVRVTFEFSV
uniref:Uncharacterized protein n=1 Tax=Mesocestoides corti TaxID=53468 RepID=A0A5K3EMW2_MESCO